MAQLVPDAALPSEVVVTIFHVSKDCWMEGPPLRLAGAVLTVGRGECGGVPIKLPKSMKVLCTGISSPQQPNEWCRAGVWSSYCAVRLSMRSAAGRRFRGLAVWGGVANPI